MKVILFLSITSLFISCARMPHSKVQHRKDLNTVHIPSKEEESFDEIYKIAKDENEVSDKDKVELEKAIKGKYQSKGIQSKKIKIVLNPQVKKWIHYFSVKDRERFGRYLNRGIEFKDIIQTTLYDNGMPKEFYYLAMIESGYAKHVRSRASAVGVWQFIRGTATRYGLKVKNGVDERRDPIRSTIAAVKYLKDLYNAFQSWELAMSAYNWGERRILSAIMRGNTRDYWELSEKRLLPRETRNYFPKFLAAAIIGENPSKYGFTIKKPIGHYEDIKGVNVPTPIRLKTVSKLTGISMTELRQFNSHILNGVVPYSKNGYKVWVRTVNEKTLEGSYQKLSQNTLKRSSRYVATYNGSKKIHTVRKNESLYSIAKKYNVSWKDLKRWNRLRRSTIYKGQKLSLYNKKITRTRNRSRSRNIARASKAHFYTVKSGDSLYKIAKRNNTTIRHLKRLNSLRRNSIRIGQRLLLNSTKNYTYYRVKRGDTLSGISRRFGTTIRKIKRMNSLASNNLMSGVKLKIPNS